MNISKKDWKKRYPEGKATLSWNLEDYEIWEQEAPSCLFFGKTEGEALSTEDINGWIEETIKTIKVIKEEYPLKYDTVYNDLKLDLAYLESLGKISKADIENILKEENFDF